MTAKVHKTFWSYWRHYQKDSWFSLLPMPFLIYVAITTDYELARWVVVVLTSATIFMVLVMLYVFWRWYHLDAWKRIEASKRVLEESKEKIRVLAETTPPDHPNYATRQEAWSLIRDLKHWSDE